MTRFLFGIILTLTPLLSLAQSPKQILQESENRRRGVESSYSEMTMEIIRPDWTRTMSLKSWGRGDEYALILVTAPARDKGTATLKRGNEVWNWMPRIERTIKLPPSMMSQSWMGADITNEDLVREVSIVDDYTHTMLQDSVIEGRTCWKIQLVPKEGIAVVWGKVNLWVDQKDYLQMRTEFFDEDGYLVNVMQASQVKNMGGRPFATRLEVVPVEEEGNKTILTFDKIVFDDAIPESFFSVQNMKRVR
ncbi:MAG: outer membrane lipoprotein-sorting protein [Bacteroidetes bacterium]|nr:MAG: outer membrane lipoprotein-sorting protein [Bacteroidota bacterium]